MHDDRPRPAKLSGAQRARLHRDGLRQMERAAHLRAVFGPALWDDPVHAALLADCSLVVGMHPDQASFPLRCRNIMYRALPSSQARSSCSRGFVSDLTARNVITEGDHSVPTSSCQCFP